MMDGPAAFPAPPAPQPRPPRAPRPAAPALPPGGVGIDAHGLVEVRTGVGNYILSLIEAMGRVAPAADVRLYLHDLPPEPLPYPVVRVPRSPLWTSLRLPLHLARRGGPAAMLYPAHTLPLLPRGRNVVTVHDLAFELLPEQFRRRDRARLSLTTRHAARHADHLIAVSRSTRDDLVRVLGVEPERVTVVHHGYDARRFRPAPRARVQAVRRRHGLDRPYVLAVGTLQVRKNHATLVRALPLLREAGIDVDLAVCGGEGWHFERTRRLVEELGLGDRVRFLGYVPQEDLPALYTGAAAGALVSRYEGFGMPVLESLACGTPLVVSNVSSLPEVGGDAVLTADPGDPADVALALARLIGEPGVRERLAARIPAHLRGFSWERAAEATLRVLARAAR